MKNTKMECTSTWRRIFICIGFTLVVNAIAYHGTRLITGGMTHYDLTGPIEEKIPFLPWTILIYWGCYFYWGVNYMFGGSQMQKETFRFFSADFLAKILCLVFFVIFPTTNMRPTVEGNTWADGMMRMLYRVDAADNLFPSIHCLTSWFAFLAVWGRKDIPKRYQWVSLLWTLSICISTLTTKQHVLPDVFAGIFLAQGSYMLVDKIGFSDLYGRWVTTVEKIIDRKS